MPSAGYDFVILARVLASNRDYRKSFNMFLCAFEKEPRIKSRYENDFRLVLSKLNEQLVIAGNKADIFSNFEQAIQVFPGNVDLLSDCGRYLFKYGYFQEALCHFEKALNIDNSYASIERNLNNVKSFLFPRCRFRALNDEVRNSAYRAAIRQVVVPGVDSVLDMDCGAGLLALFASACRPVAVTACEAAPSMARLAELAMQEQLAQEVVVVHRPAAALGPADVYGARSVLLTDALDAGLFGEYVLQALAHAWERLLLPGARVVPGRARYWLAGARCPRLRHKYQLSAHAKCLLHVPRAHAHCATRHADTYRAEDVPRYDVAYVSEPAPLLSVDFNSYRDVRRRLLGRRPPVATLTATEDGELDVLVGWFELQLSDGVALTTDPRAPHRARAWQQAVFFDLLPRRLRRGRQLRVPFSTSGGRLATLPEPDVPVARLAPDALAFLNDHDYMDLIVKAVPAVCVHLCQTVQFEEVDIVELTPFPLFGILMMRRGANSLICHVKAKEDEAFLHTVLEANAVPKEKVTILVGENWSFDVFRGKKFHAIFSNVIDFNGDIDLRTNRLVHHLKHAHLAAGGMCLPESVEVTGQLVNSTWLETNNRVVDGPLARHVNRYASSTALYVETAVLEYVPLTPSVELGAAEPASVGGSRALRVEALADGAATAVLCCYHVTLLTGWEPLATDRPGSFANNIAHMLPQDTHVCKGDEVNILVCFDTDGSYKLVVDIEPY
ncbi:protein arginine N-methyltransferase 9-like [Anticarsia gemmatalis]|uniref:protein arginine N-methyltransferase 9-like n=1 Tax=Anticarsia gemmatalis TaxID=129554 RepID=UPI003F771BF5